MEWIKKEMRLPDEEKDGIRVETFSPIYPKDSEMRHRIMNAQFIIICSEVTHWRKLDEPCEGKNVDASDSNCTIHGVRLSLPTIRDMYDEAYGRYTQPTQEHMKNTFIEGAKWCRDITKELSENGNEA